jgi:hypothetical protein
LLLHFREKEAVDAEFAKYSEDSSFYVIIKDGLTSIADKAFQSCSNIVNIEIVDSITIKGSSIE